MEISVDPDTHRIISLDKDTRKEIFEWLTEYLKTGKQNPSTAICPWFNIWAKTCGKSSNDLHEFIDMFNEHLSMFVQFQSQGS